MKRAAILTLIVMCIVAAAAGVLALRRGPDLGAAVAVPRLPQTTPSYHGTTIPPNIAPLNFYVEETGRRYCARLRAGTDHVITVTSREPLIDIPRRQWRKLLAVARGGELLVEVYVQGEDRSWNRYRSFTLHVAREKIDPFIAYRMLRPNYSFWRSIGVYQRDLESWRESVILHGRSFNDGCVNCHTFRNNQPDLMLLGLRGSRATGTLLATGDRVDKINTKWGYASWHPSGRIAVYTVMKVRQFTHTAAAELREVIDLDAALLYYDLDTRTVKTTPGIADDQRLETYPTWSPDGRTLYFCSAPIPWEDRDSVPPKGFDKVRYDLRRISYDPDSDSWGKPETVLSSAETGMSILLPRVSPDGRFLLFCMCDRGCFPIHRPSSDLYLLDLHSGRYAPLTAANSEQSESWHAWSSNGRWIIFSSRRRDGHFTRLFMSHIAEDGTPGKPFILPQRDPAYYDSLLETYNVPEFITGPVPFSRRSLVRAARRAPTIEVHNPLVTGATPRAGAAETSEPYRKINTVPDGGGG